MDEIINYLLLTIVFVFDPLAISLVIAANYAFEQLKPKTKENLYGEKIIIEEEPVIISKPPNPEPLIEDKIQEVEEIVKNDIQTPPQGNNKSGVYPKKKP